MGGSPGNHGLKAEINVTPMIDLLLVLLVIFMIVTPTTSTGLPALVPQGQRTTGGEDGLGREIVLTVRADGMVLVNQEALPFSSLQERLRRIYSVRGNTVIFLKGESGLDFGRFAQVLDLAQGTGLTQVALIVTP